MSKKYNTLGEWAKDTCDAIRSKDGTSDPIPHGDIPDRIKAITTGSDVAGVTATPADVSENVKFVDSSGTLQSGTMPEIAGSETVLDSTTTETTIPAGHHGGTGKVKIVPDTNNTFTPTTETKEYTPSSGKVYTKVIINASEAVDLSGVTASASDVLSGKKFMSSGGVLTDGTMVNQGAWTDTRTGTGRITIPAGYHDGTGYTYTYGATSYVDNSSGTTARANHILKDYTCYSNGVKVTGTIESQAAQTITPGTSNKTISSGVYLSGTQTIKGDSNLVASNIKSGVGIFDVTGTYTGDGGGGISWIKVEISIGESTDSFTDGNGIYLDDVKAIVLIGGYYSTGNIVRAWFYCPSNLVDIGIHSSSASTVGSIAEVTYGNSSTKKNVAFTSSRYKFLGDYHIYYGR